MAKNSNTFWCYTCGKKIGGLKKLQEHLRDVHSIGPKAKCKSEMTAHIDARTWFSTSYTITVKGVKLHQEIVCQRDKDDPSRYA